MRRRRIPRSLETAYALTRFKKAAATAARKEKMTCKNNGAAKQHTISPRKAVAGQESMERHMTFSAMLSTIELRRLVAAMVD